MKRNITFSFDDALLGKVLALAADRKTSANELARAYFENLLRSGVGETGTLNGNAKSLFDYSIGNIGRSEARRRLGVADDVLTQMLSACGFPPPRADATDEDAMLQGMRGIKLVKA